jgi:DNA polymerase kappa
MSNSKIKIVNPYTKRKRKLPDGIEKEKPPSNKEIRHDIGNATGNSDTNTNTNTNTNNFPKNTGSSNINVSAQASALCISASDKAGMEGIDREKIATIILKESGNSAYIQQQRRRDEKVNERVRHLQQRLQEASPRDYRVTDELDDTLRGYQQRQANRATCVVVDMDMFYMACELLSRPHLNDKPACVGREMILTSNYVARRYGVRSAMAGFIGRKLVEQLSDGREKLIQVPSNFKLYKEKSKIVNEVIREYDPHNMKAYSLDEVYLDIGPYLVLFLQHKDWTHEQIREAVLQGGDNKSDENMSNDEESYVIISQAEVMQFLQSQSSMTCLKAVEEVVFRLRQHVKKATGGLTCSAGIARTHTIAKIASDANKPNGQLVVDPVSTLEFVRALPVRKIPGVGRVTEKLLQQVCNIHTGLELYEKRGLVQFLFQPATAEFLLKSSVGCSGEGSSFASFGTEQEESSDHQKGISRERSFSPESDWALLNIKLEEISRMLSEDMKRKSVMGHTVTVKVKLANFDVLNRAQSQKQGIYIQNPDELSTVCSELFSAIRAQHKKDYNQSNKSKDRDSRFSVRLLGIRCSNLIEESSFEAKQKGKIEKFFTVTPSSENSPKCKTTSCYTNNGSENSCMTEKKDEVNRKLLFNRYAKIQNGKGALKDNATAITIATTTTASTNTNHTENAENNVHSPINYNRKNKTNATAARATIKTAFAAAVATATTTSNTGQPQPQTKHYVDIDDKQEEANEEEYVSCPICNRSFLAKDNAKFNTHIDACLNSDTVRKTIREQDCKESQKSHKRQRLTDFWS